MSKTFTVAVLVAKWKKAATRADFVARVPRQPADVINRAATELRYGPTGVDLWDSLVGSSWRFGCGEFWERGTYGFLKILAVVIDSGTVPLNQIDFWHSGQDNERSSIVAAFRQHAAKLPGVDLAKFDQIVAAPHPGPTNTGGLGHPSDVVLTLANELDVIQHELGHLIGFDHPWGVNHDGAILEYHDPYCAMGFSGAETARAVDPFDGAPTTWSPAFWRSDRRPSVATVYRWVDEFRSSTHVRQIAPGRASVRAAAEPGGGLPHLLVLPISNGLLFVEYRPNQRAVPSGTFFVDDFDDLGLPGESVVVHSQGVRANSPRENGTIEDRAQHLIYEGAVRAEPGKQLRLHGHTVRVVSASPDTLDVDCSGWSLQTDLGGVRFGSAGSRMDVVVKDGRDMAIRSWSPFTGWTERWQYLLPAGGDFALTTTYPQPSTLVTIGRDGRPLVSRFGSLNGGGWMYLGGRRENGETVHEDPPKVSNAARIAASEIGGTHVTLMVDTNGTLWACTLNTVQGPSREGRWHRPAAPALDPTFKPVIEHTGSSFHVVARTQAGDYVNAQLTSNAHDPFVPAMALATTWGPWTTLPMSLSYGVPTTLCTDAHRLWLAFVDLHGNAQVAEYNGSWSAPRQLGGEFWPGSTLGAVSRTGNSLDVFGVDRTGTVQMFSGSVNGGFTPPTPIHGWTFSPPGMSHVHAVSRGADHLELLVDKEFDQLRMTWWSPANGWQWFHL